MVRSSFTILVGAVANMDENVTKAIAYASLLNLYVLTSILQSQKRNIIFLLYLHVLCSKSTQHNRAKVRVSVKYSRTQIDAFEVAQMHKRNKQMYINAKSCVVVLPRNLDAFVCFSMNRL